MNKFLDYQWPNTMIKKCDFDEQINKKNNKKKIIKIERFFEKKFGVGVRLFPSGRSCIGAILEYERVNRSHEVYVSKWVSNCIFNTVGYYSNPTVNFKNQKILIINNSWGLDHKVIKRKNGRIIIDDSCDSIIINKKALFPNKSKYEIFSLPKVIGSVTGGLVISKDKKFLKFCRERQKKNKKLGFLQSKMKFDEINNKLGMFEYRYKEPINSYNEPNSLKDIYQKLKNYDLNKNIILSRINFLKKTIKFKAETSKKVGPMVLIKINKKKKEKKLSRLFIFKHKLINIKNNFSKKYLLFPVHFKIGDKLFHNYYYFLSKNL